MDSGSSHGSSHDGADRRLFRQVTRDSENPSSLGATVLVSEKYETEIVLGRICIGGFIVLVLLPGNVCTIPTFFLPALDDLPFPPPPLDVFPG